MYAYAGTEMILFKSSNDMYTDSLPLCRRYSVNTAYLLLFMIPSKMSMVFIIVVSVTDGIQTLFPVLLAFNYAYRVIGAGIQRHEDKLRTIDQLDALRRSRSLETCWRIAQTPFHTLAPSVMRVRLEGEYVHTPSAKHPRLSFRLQ